MLNEIATPFLQIATPIANSHTFHGTNLSRAVNLHLSRSEHSESTQRALREHSESTHRALRRHSESTQIALKIRVISSEPKILRLVQLEAY